MAGVQFGESPYLQEERPVYSCTYSPDGKSCAIGLRDSQISVYSTLNWEKFHTLKGHTDSVRSVVYSPSESQIASGSLDDTIRLWDAQSGAHVRTIEGHTDGVWSVAYSPSGSQIASGSFDNTVRLWDVASGQCRAVIEGFDGGLWSIVWKMTRDGSYLVTGSADKSVRRWQVKKEREETKAILCWSSGHKVLTVKGALFEGGRGLSERNEKLLTQRGARLLES